MMFIHLQDYSDLNVPLSSIQVTNFTAAELTRLCLRKKDSSDEDIVEEEEEEEEVVDAMVRRSSGLFGRIGMFSKMAFESVLQYTLTSWKLLGSILERS